MKLFVSRVALAVSLVAELDDHVVGFALARVYYGEFGVVEPAAVLDVLGVHPDYRGRRVASALIDQLRPDVAVLDIQMPKRSGIDVCRHVRAQHWPIGLLILTAYDDPPYVLAVLQAGANGYVLKTADADDIIQAVYDVHEGKSVLDPTIARKLMTQLAGQFIEKPIDSLTPREMDVLKLAAQGLTNKAIGAQLSVSDRTVQGHLANIYGKLSVSTRTEAVLYAVREKWITLE